jgi:hypothetical protein
MSRNFLLVSCLLVATIEQIVPDESSAISSQIFYKVVYHHIMYMHNFFW